MPATRVSGALQHLDRVRHSLDVLQGRADALAGRLAAVRKQVALDKALVDLGPEAVELLSHLTEKAHAKAVGDLEVLLTALVADVLPEIGTIKLIPSVSRKVPALDIRLQTPEGHIEDVFSANGGALTNVVAVGCLFAAWARTATRGFLTLDEPDHWMKPDLVPAFSRVIADTARRAGCQVVMVSHHTPDVIDPSFNLIELGDSATGPVVLNNDPYPWKVEERGVRWLRAKNLQAHSDTRIDFWPGPNAIVGRNNLGKSALIVTAFRMLVLGDMDDTVIRHGAARTEVSCEIEGGIVLECIRNASGTPKALYRLYEHGVLKHEEAPKSRGAVPEFITKAMNIALVDDLDLHFRSQKDKVFLLSEPPARRAQLLSVGRETGLLVDVMEAHRVAIRRATERITDGEQQITQLLRELDTLAPVASLQALMPLAKSSGEECLQALAAAAKHRALAERFATLQPLAGLRDRLPATAPQAPTLTPGLAHAPRIYAGLHLAPASRLVLPPAPRVPVLAEAPHARRIARQLETGAPWGAISMPAAPMPPVVQATQRPIMARLQQLQQACALLSHIPARAPGLPALSAAGRHETHRSLASCQAEVLKTAAQLDQAGATRQGAADAVHQVQHELGVCPLCAHEFNGEI